MRTPKQIIGEDAYLQLIFEGYAVVPMSPTPEMLGAWYRHKNGFHYADEEPPKDTSDIGAYSAMIFARPNK